MNEAEDFTTEQNFSYLFVVVKVYYLQFQCMGILTVFITVQKLLRLYSVHTADT